MKDRFPKDVDYAVSLDQTLPVSEGNEAKLSNLVIGDLLVILWCTLFASWRAADSYAGSPGLLVAHVCPVPAIGFSINTLRCWACPGNRSGWLTMPFGG